MQPNFHGERAQDNDDDDDFGEGCSISVNIQKKVLREVTEKQKLIKIIRRQAIIFPRTYHERIKVRELGHLKAWKTPREKKERYAENK